MYASQETFSKVTFGYFVNPDVDRYFEQKIKNSGDSRPTQKPLLQSLKKCAALSILKRIKFVLNASISTIQKRLVFSSHPHNIMATKCVFITGRRVFSALPNFEKHHVVRPRLAHQTPEYILIDIF